VWARGVEHIFTLRGLIRLGVERPLGSIIPSFPDVIISFVFVPIRLNLIELIAQPNMLASNNV
jgi:hypothetical protein